MSQIKQNITQSIIGAKQKINKKIQIGGTYAIQKTIAKRGSSVKDVGYLFILKKICIVKKFISHMYNKANLIEYDYVILL